LVLAILEFREQFPFPLKVTFKVSYSLRTRTQHSLSHATSTFASICPNLHILFVLNIDIFRKANQGRIIKAALDAKLKN